MQSLINNIIQQVDQIVLGKNQQVRLSLACLFAEGHLLIEDLVFSDHLIDISELVRAVEFFEQFVLLANVRAELLTQRIAIEQIDEGPRLARALVSDIVTYHPERRDKALADGTLKREFMDEIKKSWEEYVGQVGADAARSAPHFRDALNDILAKGQQLF